MEEEGQQTDLGAVEGGFKKEASNDPQSATYVWTRDERESSVSETGISATNVSSHPRVRMCSDIQEVQEGENRDSLMDNYHDLINTSQSFSQLPRRIFDRRRTRELSIIQQETGCFRYFPVAACAKYIVNEVIQRAENRIMIAEASDEKIEPSLEEQFNLNIWPNVGNFTESSGLSAIETYLMYSCQFREDWSYKITLLEKKPDCISDYYLYEVKFSLPTRVYPIAQATTSLYFNIEVCRNLPPACAIRVHFQLEGLSFKFSPFQYIINDQMLLRTIQSKINLFKRVKF